MPRITDFSPLGGGVYLFVSWLKPHEIMVPFSFRVGFKLDGMDKIYTVDAGLVTDLASIPRPIQGWLIEKLGAHMLPAVIHDHMCVTKWETYELAAEVFDAAMQYCRLPESTRHVMHSAVLRFGPKWGKIEHATG